MVSKKISLGRKLENKLMPNHEITRTKSYPKKS